LVHVGAGPVGFILALSGGVILTVRYLNSVQDTHATWILPPIGLMIPATTAGFSIFGHAVSKGELPSWPWPGRKEQSSRKLPCDCVLRGWPWQLLHRGVAQHQVPSPEFLTEIDNCF
jgi:hypothetical protein